MTQTENKNPRGGKTETKQTGDNKTRKYLTRLLTNSKYKIKTFFKDKVFTGRYSQEKHAMKNNEPTQDSKHKGII